MPDVFVHSLPKRWLDAILALRLVRETIKRFGFINLIRKLRQYFKDKRNYFQRAPNRYVRQGKDIYVVPNLPPVNQAEFLYYLLADTESLNRSRALPLAFALVSVSARCPYHCQYCYAVQDKQEHEVLSIPILVRTIRGLVDCGVRNILLTGGEPMMRWEELPGLLEACRDNRTGFWLVSTGWKMDKAKMEIFRSHGLRGVMISLDSMDEAECVRSKGHPDGFSNAVRAIQDAKGTGLVVCVDCVMRQDLLDPIRFEEFITFVGKLGVHYINCFSPHAVKKAGGHSLTPFTLADFKKLVNLIWNAQQSRRYRELPVVYSADVWEAHRGCVGGEIFVYISPQGNVTPCPFIDKISGNILEDDISEIVKTIRAQASGEICEVNKLFTTLAK